MQVEDDAEDWEAVDEQWAIDSDGEYYQVADDGDERRVIVTPLAASQVSASSASASQTAVSLTAVSQASASQPSTSRASTSQAPALQTSTSRASTSQAPASQISTSRASTSQTAFVGSSDLPPKLDLSDIDWEAIDDIEKKGIEAKEQRDKEKGIKRKPVSPVVTDNESDSDCFENSEDEEKYKEELKRKKGKERQRMEEGKEKRRKERDEMDKYLAKPENSRLQIFLPKNLKTWMVSKPNQVRKLIGARTLQLQF